MNAGMYRADASPVGLLVVEGKQVAPLNLSDGNGNFFVKPHGVFLLSASGARVVEAAEYPKPALQRNDQRAGLGPIVGVTVDQGPYPSAEKAPPGEPLAAPRAKR